MCVCYLSVHRYTYTNRHSCVTHNNSKPPIMFVSRARFSAQLTTHPQHIVHSTRTRLLLLHGHMDTHFGFRHMYSLYDEVFLCVLFSGVRAIRRRQWTWKYQTKKLVENHTRYRARAPCHANTRISMKLTIQFLLLFGAFTGWELRDLSCYKYFGIKHSWEKAAELCRR